MLNLAVVLKISTYSLKGEFTPLVLLSVVPYRLFGCETLSYRDIADGDALTQTH